MSKTKAGPISADRLKSFIERVERLEGERAAIGADIRDIYSEAKGVGYDVKTMRRIVQLRKKDVAERDEEEQLLDLYAHALGMVVGGADLSGIGQTSHAPDEDELMDVASRVVHEVDLCATHLVAMDGKPPKIEAIKSLIGCSTGKAAKLRALVIERLEGFSRRITADRENGNENRKGAGSQITSPGEGAGTTDRPDGPGSVAANPLPNKEVDVTGVEPDARSEPSRPAEQSVNAGPPSEGTTLCFHPDKGDDPAPHNPDWIESPPPLFDRRQRVA